MSGITNAIGITATNGYAYEGTFASKPSASEYPAGTKIWVTDIGINGSEFISNGATWTPHNGQTLLTRLTLSLVKAPTFTGTTDGAITLGTAVGTLYPKCYMYFPANSLVASHSAGWYYAEMSSTTAAVVYNNTYTPAAGTFPTEPTSKTAFSGAVPGGTGSTAEITAFTFSLPANLLGNYGSMLTRISCEFTNNANQKIIKLKQGATTLSLNTNTTTVGVRGISEFKNIGSASSNRSSGVFSIANQGVSEVSTSIDTTSAVTFDITLQSASAGTDIISLTSASVSVEVA